MHVIVGVGLGFALLCVWLTGHWVGRVAGFLGFTVLFGGLALLLGGQELGAIGGIIAAWFVSGIPTYVARRRPRIVVYPPGHDVTVRH